MITVGFKFTVYRIEDFNTLLKYLEGPEFDIMFCHLTSWMSIPDGIKCCTTVGNNIVCIHHKVPINWADDKKAEDIRGFMDELRNVYKYVVMDGVIEYASP